MDRVYRVKCEEANMVNNYVVASITINTPSLNVNVTASPIPVSLHVYRKQSNGQYSVVTSTIEAGTKVRLQLEYTRNSPYNVEQDPYGVFTYTTTAGSTAALTQNDRLVTDDGCATTANKLLTGANHPPFYASKGFKGVVNTFTNKYILTTGDFYIWKYDGSSAVHFNTFFGICYESTKAMCDNYCLYKSGNEPLRKRRQADKELRVATTYVFVTDQQDGGVKTSDSSATMMTVIIVGSVVGTVIVCFAVLLVCMFAVYRRRMDKARDINSPGKPMPAIVPGAKC